MVAFMAKKQLKLKHGPIVIIKEHDLRMKREDARLNQHQGKVTSKNIQNKLYDGSY